MHYYAVSSSPPPNTALPPFPPAPSIPAVMLRFYWFHIWHKILKIIWLTSSLKVIAEFYHLNSVLLPGLDSFGGYPGGPAGKESVSITGDLGSIPGLGRSPGERKGYPLQNSGLENSMDCIVHGVAKSQTQLRDS